MDLSAAHHHHHHFHPQEMGSDPQSLDIVVACSKAAAAHNPHQQQAAQDKKPRPPDNEPQKCPRCDSTNTKFCYYNNYSLTQPRYFCKSCRRYWTKGGTLRNVPVGGGCRKNNKRSSSSSSNSACSSPSSSSSSLLKRPHSQDFMAMAATHHPNPLFSALHLPNSFSSYAGGLGLGFDAMGNATLTDCSDPAVMGGAFLDHQGSGGLFQNLCYGFGGADNSNCVSGISEDMGLVAYDEGGSSTAVTTVKQENRGGLWGLPWQMNGDHGVGGGIEGWNGVMGNSAWHGLLNTPAALM